MTLSRNLISRIFRAVRALCPEPQASCSMTRIQSRFYPSSSVVVVSRFYPRVILQSHRHSYVVSFPAFNLHPLYAIKPDCDPSVLPVLQPLPVQPLLNLFHGQPNPDELFCKTIWERIY